ncbi:MAG: glycosyltransferase family 87 protein, partial [Ginsengibacter sp.]
MYVIIHSSYYLLPILACVCFYYLKIKNKDSKKIIWIFYSFIFIISSFVFIQLTITQLYEFKVWDFNAFYLFGKAGVSGKNFYLPETFQAVFNALDLPPLDYRQYIPEVVNVGFIYPPPTILLFAPLGLLSYKTALTCWIIFNFFFAIGCIYLSYDLFMKKYKLNGFMLVVILFCLFMPVRSTVVYSQTNFILLFLLLLMKKYSDKKISGILLAVAFFIKPYMIIFGLYFLLRKQWKPIIYCIITSLILVGFTILVYGVEPFITYIYDNPIKRYPVELQSDMMHQSLNAVLIRLHLISITDPSIYYYIASAVLL